MERTPVKDRYGRIIGVIELDTVRGDKIVKDQYGRILGRYSKSQDVTKDQYGRIVVRGDNVSILLNTDFNK